MRQTDRYAEPCDIPYGPGNPDYEHDRRRDEDDERNSATVARAFADVDIGITDSNAVHEVLQRRAGDVADYHRLRAHIELADSARRACGVTA